MTIGIWLRFLARHRFRISPSRLPRALGMTLIALVSTIPAAVQRRRHGAEIDAEPLPTPVFIVGHWRSGTTFLHELLATDPRFIAPTSLECFATDHFLRWGRMLSRLHFLFPARRPMDDMAMGWDRPQEDEFALMAMGQRSPYEIMAFPHDRAPAIEHLHVGDWPAARREAWAAALVIFMKRVAVGRRWARGKNPQAVTPRWILLKSPTHTARIGVLKRLFPDAKFIHLARDPFELYGSSERLWRETCDGQGLQRPRLNEGPNQLSALILNTLPELYRDFETDTQGMTTDSWAELRYPDLVGEPETEIARVLDELGMGEPDRDAIRAHLAGLRSYRRNRHELDPHIANAITTQWRWYFERFGFDPVPPEASSLSPPPSAGP